MDTTNVTVQQTFNTIMSFLMAKFVLNDVPHAIRSTKKFSLQESVSIANKLIVKSGEPTADPRYSTMVLEYRVIGRKALERLLAGEKLTALTWAGGFGCGLTTIGQPMFYFMSVWPEPVPSGSWMGLPEKHWGISESKWELLTLVEKAKLEAGEQASRYVAKEYYGCWLDSYAPTEADKIWWDEGGHKLSSRGKLLQLEQVYRQKAIEVRRAYLGDSR